VKRVGEVDIVAEAHFSTLKPSRGTLPFRNFMKFVLFVCFFFFLHVVFVFILFIFFCV
jgi:hypothetical protein